MCVYTTVQFNETKNVYTNTFRRTYSQCESHTHGTCDNIIYKSQGLLMLLLSHRLISFTVYVFDSILSTIVCVHFVYLLNIGRTIRRMTNEEKKMKMKKIQNAQQNDETQSDIKWKNAIWNAFSFAICVSIAHYHFFSFSFCSKLKLMHYYWKRNSTGTPDKVYPIPYVYQNKIKCMHTHTGDNILNWNLPTRQTNKQMKQF